MSVYTVVKREQLAQLLSQYSIGELLDYQGISAGIDNTNYFVTTSCGEFVLTLFESLDFNELPYFLALMAHLSEHGVPCAHPVADINNKFLRTLNQRPAAIVNKLPGKDHSNSTKAHAKELGRVLAKLHIAGQSFNQKKLNTRGEHWWQQTTERLKPYITEDVYRFLVAEIRFQQTVDRHSLPNGVTHADLFKDNVLWIGDELTGVIDFYYACSDCLLYDIAVTANAWFSTPDGKLDTELTCEFLSSYHHFRPLETVEHQNWPAMLRASALRFLLSRLNDKHFPKPGEITHVKNPQEFYNILSQRIQASQALKQIWI